MQWEKEWVIQRNKKLLLVFRRDWASSTSRSRYVGDAPTTLHWQFVAGKKISFLEDPKCRRTALEKQEKSVGSTVICKAPRVNTTMEEPPLPHFPKRVQLLPAGKLKWQSQNQENGWDGISLWRSPCPNLRVPGPCPVGKVYSIFSPHEN